MSVDSEYEEWQIGYSGEDGVHHCHALLVVHAQDVVAKQFLRLVGRGQNERILEKSEHLFSLHVPPQSLVVGRHADSFI